MSQLRQCIEHIHAGILGMNTKNAYHRTYTQNLITSPIAKNVHYCMEVMSWY
jgi:hypothetical protein